MPKDVSESWAVQKEYVRGRSTRSYVAVNERQNKASSVSYSEEATLKGKE